MPTIKIHYSSRPRELDLALGRVLSYMEQAIALDEKIQREDAIMTKMELLAKRKLPCEHCNSTGRAETYDGLCQHCTPAHCCCCGKTEGLSRVSGYHLCRKCLQIEREGS